MTGIYIYINFPIILLPLCCSAWAYFSVRVLVNDSGKIVIFYNFLYNFILFYVKTPTFLPLDFQVSAVSAFYQGPLTPSPQRQHFGSGSGPPPSSQRADVILERSLSLGIIWSTPVYKELLARVLRSIRDYWPEYSGQ